MRRKLLFVIPEYSHGGTNKSLENLLAFIDHTKYDISIYCLYEDGGDYYKQVFAPYVLKKSRLYYWMHDNACTKKFMGLYNKLTKEDHFTWLYKREVRCLQMRYTFDVVVAYQEGTATVFVSYLKNDVKKIAWIHFDYVMLKDRVDLSVRKKWYDCYHQIVCVSQAALTSMLTVHPEYKDKSTYIYNALDIDVIIKAGEESVESPLDKNVFNILSIGRLVTIKQFHIIPEIVNAIRNLTTIPFRWYIMGSGECENLIRAEILKYNLQDVVILTGVKDNPYPYIRQADLVVCTSVAESFSYVIAEAKVLHTPVLSNDFPVAYEVVDETMGWIANIKDMPQVLTRIIDNVDNEYDRKKAAAMNFEYSNEQVLKKIDDIFQN